MVRTTEKSLNVWCWNTNELYSCDFMLGKAWWNKPVFCLKMWCPCLFAPNLLLNLTSPKNYVYRQPACHKRYRMSVAGIKPAQRGWSAFFYILIYIFIFIYFILLAPKYPWLKSRTTPHKHHPWTLQVSIQLYKIKQTILKTLLYT